MSRAALLRALHGKPVTYSVTYTGPTRMERLPGVEWLRVHGHRTERRGVLEVRSRDVVFWDERREAVAELQEAEEDRPEDGEEYPHVTAMRAAITTAEKVLGVS